MSFIPWALGKIGLAPKNTQRVVVATIDPVTGFVTELSIASLNSCIAAGGAAMPANRLAVGYKASAATPANVAEGAITAPSCYLNSIPRGIGDNPTDGVQDVSVKNWPGDTPQVIQAIDGVFNSASAVTSTEIDISRAKKIGILIKSVVDRTAATPILTYTVTVAATLGGVHVACPLILTSASLVVPAVSVVHTSASDATLYFAGFLPQGLAAGGLKVVATPTDCAVGETIDADCWIVLGF